MYNAAQPVAGKPVTAEEVRQGFEHVHPTARKIIDHGKDWKLWVLCDREPVANWRDGRVVLLGDAAHPMLQYFAQGACMAMEDAVCIATELSGTPDVETAFAAYQAKRSLRTARVQLQSRWIGEHIYHPAGGHAALRNAIMRARTPTEWYDSVEWLYGGPGAEGAFGAAPRAAGAAIAVPA